MIVPQNYAKLRQETNLSSVSLGHIRVHLFKVEELDKAQLGYSIDLNGNSLVDGENESWKDYWLVIGSEDCCGDPIFIDCTNEKYPVFTAMQGEDEWDETLIADTFESFIKTLECIQNISKDRENPVKLENNPITSNENDRVLKDIRKYNIKADLFFWKNWLAQE